jgi:hypothetical protein
MVASIRASAHLSHRQGIGWRAARRAYRGNSLCKFLMHNLALILVEHGIKSKKVVPLSIQCSI